MCTEDFAYDADFAAALREPGLPEPEGLTFATAHRFAVYRNTIAVRHIEALEARFPAVREAVGASFFAATARAFFTEHPPLLPMLAFYGDELPGFLRRFPPAAEIPYLPDLAELEARRTRAAYSADAEPLPGETLAQLTPESLARMHVSLHPSIGIVSSIHPIATIWAMNSGALPVAPISDWCPEDVVIARPRREVELRRLQPGGAAFLRALADEKNLSEAASAALSLHRDFDLGFNLAGLFDFGLVTRLSFEPHEGH
ncbi:MAG: putative DNA-binding domain-containing protein [Beijerinckiaceae bacterium]